MAPKYLIRRRSGSERGTISECTSWRKLFWPVRQQKSFFVLVCFRFCFYHNFARISRFMNEKHCPTSETREGPKNLWISVFEGKKLFQNFLLLFSSPHEKHPVTAVTHFRPTTPFSSFLMAEASFLLFKHLWGCLNRKLTLVSCPATPLLASSASSSI